MKRIYFNKELRNQPEALIALHIRLFKISKVGKTKKLIQRNGLRNRNRTELVRHLAAKRRNMQSVFQSILSFKKSLGAAAAVK